MAGAKKRAGSQISSAVRAKSPRKSTVADAQIPKDPIAKDPEPPKKPKNADTFETPETPAPLKKVCKKRGLQKHPPPPTEIPRKEITKPMTPEVKPLENPAPSAVPEAPPKKSIKKSTKCPEKLSVEIQNLSPGTGKLLDCFIKQHSNSLANLQKRDLIMSKKMRSIAMESLKKKAENAYLKKEFAKTKRELTHLQKDLAEQQDKNTETIKKYEQINEKFAKCEKNYDEHLGIIKACVEKNNKELKLAQTRIVDKDCELKNMQQTNRELAAALSNYKAEMEKSERTNTEINERLTGITQAYEDLRLQFTDLSGEKEICEANILELSTELNAKIIICAELEGRIEELPIETNKALSKLQSELESCKLRCEEQQRFTDQAEKELELARNEINTLKTLIEEREQSYISLSGENQEIKARMVELVDINENYSKELAKTQLKHSQDMKEQANKHGIALRELKDQLKKASNDFEQLRNSSESLQKKSLLRISQLQGEINEMELQSKNQMEVIANLGQDLLEKTSSFEDRLKGQQEQLSNQVQIMKTEFQCEVQRSTAEIQTLKAAIEQKDAMFNAQQEKLQSLLTDLDKLKDTVANLEAKKQKMVGEFSASKMKFSEELKSQKETLMKTISGLELEIQNKETKMIELERNKNHEMAVLKFKMNRINSVIDQPINTLPEQPPLKVSKPQSITNKVTPEKVEGPSSSSKKRRPRITTTYESDFASEDEKPISSSYLTGKRIKLSAVVKPQKEDDLFDILKKSN
ncbi:hypothetical protein KR084_005254 [Drosophila pseudotakahashii]|nr:hypothetical protein KR084_005254 [Drosophila pseudotakahashii]